MPGMGGRRCLEQLVKTDPNVKVIIASGYAVDGGTRAVVEAGAKGFVGKPYVVREMLKVIRQTMDAN